MNTKDNNDRSKTLAYLPKRLARQIRAQLSLRNILLVARVDLNRQNQYAQGYLILTEKMLGAFFADEEQWNGKWHQIDLLSKVEIVEGLGVSSLRLLSDGQIAAEYRFTLRHARDVAALYRRLEQLIDGKNGQNDLEIEEFVSEEKKVHCEKCGRVIPAWSENCPACMVRRKILFRLLDYVRPHKIQTIIGLSVAALITVLELAQPFLRKPMIDKGLGAAKPHEPNVIYFLILVGVLALLMVLTAIAHGVQHRLIAALGSSIGRDMRDKAYRHLHKLSLSFFSRKQTGSLVTRITTDSERITRFVTFASTDIIQAFLIIIGASFALFWLHWKLAIFVLLPLPLMFLMTVFFHSRLHRFFRRIWHRWSQMTSVVADALPGVRVIKAFSQEPREVERFGAKNEDVYSEQLKTIGTMSVFGPVMLICTQIGHVLIWLLGGWWIIENYRHPKPDGMTVGTLMTFVGYMHLFYRPIHRIAHMDEMFNRAATSAQRMFDILDTDPGIFSKSSAHKADSVEGKIELRNVNFSYDGIRKVLKDVSLTIEPGQMIGLAGPSGGGKTTMVNLICRFYDVMSGQILIDDIDVRDYDVDELRQQIGVVLQEPFLFHGTVMENIAYGRPRAEPDQIIEAARAANAHDFIVGFPDGYDTLVGERGQALSGGERQRISIARAILNNPRILVLDEATSSVDTETEKLIQEAIEHLVANRTTIAIAHRLSTLRKADRLIILEKGIVVEQGTHEELAGSPDGLYARLLCMQTETQSIIGVSG